MAKVPKFMAQQQDEAASSYLLRILAAIVRMQGGRIAIPLRIWADVEEGQGIQRHYDAEKAELIVEFTEAGSQSFVIPEITCQPKRLDGQDGRLPLHLAVPPGQPAQPPAKRMAQPPDGVPVVLTPEAARTMGNIVSSLMNDDARLAHLEETRATEANLRRESLDRNRSLEELEASPNSPRLRTIAEQFSKQ